MKKVLGIVVLLLAGSLSWAGSLPKLRIITTFYPLYTMTINVVGDIPGVEVVNLTPPVTGCLHDYSLTANDMKKLADADILIANGAGMESFLGSVAKQFPGLKIIYAFSQKRSGDNPHIWVSLQGAMEGARGIAKGLMEQDPLRAEKYQRNRDAYLFRIDDLRKKMMRRLEPYRGEKIVTFHEAFPYFAQEFGFEVAAVIEREPGSAPSAKEMAETITLIKVKGVRVIFIEPQYPPAAAQAIARETGVKVLTLDPGVTGPMAPDAYLQIMEKNLETLMEAFGGKD